MFKPFCDLDKGTVFSYKNRQWIKESDDSAFCPDTGYKLYVGPYVKCLPLREKQLRKNAPMQNESIESLTQDANKSNLSAEEVVAYIIEGKDNYFEASFMEEYFSNKVWSDPSDIEKVKKVLSQEAKDVMKKFLAEEN